MFHILHVQLMSFTPCILGQFPIVHYFVSYFVNSPLRTCQLNKLKEVVPKAVISSLTSSVTTRHACISFCYLPLALAHTSQKSSPLSRCFNECPVLCCDLPFDVHPPLKYKNLWHSVVRMWVCMSSSHIRVNRGPDIAQIA